MNCVLCYRSDELLSKVDEVGPDSVMGELIKDIAGNNTGMGNSIVNKLSPYTVFLDVESGFKGTELMT